MGAKERKKIRSVSFAFTGKSIQPINEPTPLEKYPTGHETESQTRVTEPVGWVVPNWPPFSLLIEPCVIPSPYENFFLREKAIVSIFSWKIYETWKHEISRSLLIQFHPFVFERGCKVTSRGVVIGIWIKFPLSLFFPYNRNKFLSS